MALAGEEGSTTPWYRGHRLLRQPRPGAWAPVVAEAVAALDEMPARRA
ncbi:MAG: hypothetical protein IPL96_04145 [Holophagaceae bacterium]|nr:hypothetical protein [Holophagaceae bacterium]